MNRTYFISAAGCALWLWGLSDKITSPELIIKYLAVSLFIVGIFAAVMVVGKRLRAAK